METAGHSNQRPLDEVRLSLVRSVIRALNSAFNAVLLYPTGSPIPREAAAAFVASFDQFVALEPELAVTVSENQLSVRGRDMCGDSTSLRRLALQLHSRQVATIRLLPGLDSDETLSLLQTLREEPDTLRAKGGLRAALSAVGVSHVEIVDLAQEAAADAAILPGTRPDAVRVAGVPNLRLDALVDPDPRHVRAWLRLALERTEQELATGEETASELAAIVASEAEHAVTLGGADAQLGLSNLSEAIAALDETSRCRLLSVLLTSVDGAGALKALLAHVDDTAIASAIAGDAAESEAPPTDLISRLRLDPARRDLIAEQVRAMIESGPPDGSGEGGSAPSPGKTETHAELPQFSRPEDSVPVAPSALAAHVARYSAEEQAFLQHVPCEAKDHDLDRSMATLLYLLNQTTEPDPARATARAVTDLAEYALAQDRTGTLAHAVTGLRLRSDNVEPASPVAAHVREALAQLSRDEVAGMVARFLDDARFDDAATYFAGAEPSAQEVLLDTLVRGDSPELEERARDVLAALGVRAIGTLGHHVTDKRWAVAHTAVVLLAKTGTRQAVPALCHALAHPHEDVALAAVDGLATIGDDEAVEALLAAMETGSRRVRIAAIEAVGRSDGAYAVDALAKLLQRRDFFGRRLDRKTAAANALATIATPAAVDALESAQRQRFLFSPGATRRLRSHLRRCLAQLPPPENVDAKQRAGREVTTDE